MAVKYFQVDLDTQLSKQWFLDEPESATGEPIDARLFTEGHLYLGAPPVNIPIDQSGRQTQFHLGAFDMPVVSDRIVNVLSQLGRNEIQSFPVLIDSRISGYSILNVVGTEDCFDETRSTFTRFTLDDDRPDKIGELSMVVQLVIDPSRTHERNIFRVKGWEVALIVSDQVKQALERFTDLGIVFTPVC